MAARAVFSGSLMVGSFGFDVKPFTAVKSDTLNFNQLHAKDHGRVRQEKKCGQCGDTLSPADIVKGIEVAPNQYILIDDSDLDMAKSDLEKSIQIDHFVSNGSIDPQWYDRPHLLAPAKEIANRGYAVLRDGLVKSKCIAIGRIIMRDRESPVAIAPLNGRLAMFKLHFPDQIRSSEDLDIEQLPKADTAEVKMAQQLIESKKIKIEEIEFKDQYREKLQSIIDAKINGGSLVDSTGKKSTAPTVDIIDALKASMKKHPKKAKRRAA